ncbi:hypothetical protein [Yanghanlia caeni]|uniref:Uncharacterized protein n=1 Tax=Yanghanlia caeni TaxID=3064283 RepID=A0ABU1D1S6_9BURK|nr:hypothetical protein [Alcaligenaceae bacterium LG-2]
MSRTGVKSVGSLDQEKLREALTTFETKTVLGDHKVNPQTGKQEGVKGLLVQIRDGQREIAFPEHLKTMEPEIPMPAWDKR